ncbi:hypothetical protein NHX12_004336 [Muraenolepis orangiensis]|uniref:Reverse transcriptase domain-containing protein n=1 Tax=Muraenolepis orangiensis TaxID=630683 RepID=A0A9Q0IFF7_9TELE|nr:hypothetical protein NHX12_004336 [Muraenolepis orangiensis]
MGKSEEFPELSDTNWLCDFAFAVDIFSHMNELNVKLQGKDQFAHDMYTNVRAFKSKLVLFSRQMSNKSFAHFPTLAVQKEAARNAKKYCKSLDDLHREFCRRFCDFEKIDKSLQLVSCPLSQDPESAPQELQLELIDLQSDSVSKEKFKSLKLNDFYASLNETAFPNLRRTAQKMLVLFGSTYVCEQTFSVMKINKAHHRSKIGTFVDEHLIPEQAGFRPGKSTTSQVLNLTQYIEDGYEEGMVTGVVFVDLSAAYDTVNHRRFLSKILETTRDTRLTELIESMLENRHFFVDLGGKKSRWRRLRNGLPQGSVLAPLLFNIYTNDQPKSADTCRFIYADDLGIGAQATDFKVVEDRRSGRANTLPSKTQVCAIHLRNREAKRQLKVSWSGTSLEHCEHPVYLGVTLDRCLSFKTHTEKTKCKVSARNNIIRKLTGTTWGANPRTLKSTALALCYSAAEYACPVWERAAHAKKLDPALNASCRLITGCLKSTPTYRSGELRGPQDVKLDGLMGDGPQKMTVQGVCRNGAWQGNVTDAHLQSEVLIIDRHQSMNVAMI